uniref:Titin n=1 Tax=Ciona savignyi TaxID=51511 RepID=H2YLF2_CIOSA
EYFFRVSAENKCGVGPNLELKSPITAMDPMQVPQVPRDLKVLTASKTGVKLGWIKPEWDGGSHITSYQVVAMKRGTKDWKEVDTGSAECQWTLNDLEEDMQYRFGIMARNKAGLSQVCVIQDYVTVCDDEIMPMVKILTTLTKNEVLVRAGTDLILRASMAGRPVPVAVWKLGDVDLFKVARSSIKTTEDETRLTISNATRADCGHYVVTATNKTGSDSASAQVNVLDKPAACVGPLKIISLNKDRCTVAWEPPADNGGCEITNYTLEKCETSRMVWSVVTASVTACAYPVPRLLEGNEYIFRVKAENKMGLGPAIESSPVVAKSPYDKPGAPSAPEITKIGNGTATIAWKAPDKDGGRDIFGYYVEKREKKGVRWSPCNTKSIMDRRLNVLGLSIGYDYQFRVAAENEMGVGEPSEPSKMVTIKEPTEVPGPPSNPKVVDTTKNSVTIKWGAPAYDGGARIIGYIVESSVEGLDDWRKCNVGVGTPKTTEFTVTGLRQEQTYVFRVAAVNEVGQGKHESIPGAVSPVEILEEPEIDLDVDMRKNIEIKAGSTLRLLADVKGRPKPTVKWTKLGATLSRRADVDVTDLKTTLVVPETNRDDSGKYTLTASNAKGSKSANINVKVLDTPGQVSNIVVKDIKATSAQISWTPPDMDGGSEITNYVVELKESDKKTWSVATTECPKTAFRVTKLVEGKDYYFRIKAENKYGVGIPADISKPVRARHPITEPGPVNKLKITDVTKSTVTLTWLKPDHTGGSKITGYVIEHQGEGTTNWSEYRTVSDTTVTVVNLANKKYKFQVKARNEELAGPPRETDVVDVKEPAEAPKITLPKELKVRSGQKLVVEAEISGKPHPVTYWMRKGVELEESEKLLIQKTSSTVSLTIPKSERHHTDEYVLRAENANGKRQGTVKEVLDRPSMPTGPVEIKDINIDTVTLTWSAPEDDGGCPISNYIVEQSEADHPGFKVISSTVSRTTLRVGKLTKDSEYVFRIKAENKCGISDALSSALIKATYPFTVPEVPRNLNVVKIGKESATLSWDVPENDGGNPVRGYNIERKEMNSLLWTLVNKSLVKRRELVDSNLLEGIEYQFRVQACNTAGAGAFCKPTDPQVARDQCDAPGKPEVVDVTDTTVELGWAPPRSDGGSKIAGYIIEKQKLPNEKWVRHITTRGPEASVVLVNLEEGERYCFRVLAKTAVVVSKPSEPTEAILVRQAIAAPSITLDASCRELLEVRAGQDIVIEATIVGKPKPTAIWTRGEEQIKSTSDGSVTAETLLNQSRIIIRSCNRSDAGNYVLTENTSGKTSATAKVRVLDVPGMPEGPAKFSNVLADRLKLIWNPPLEDGGAAITNYVIERRETSRPTWAMVSGSAQGTELTVQKLIQNHEYEFRISAENKYGIGQSLVTEPIIVKNPFSVPSAAEPPSVSNAKKEGMTVSWKSPSEDGGKPISGYYLEKRETKAVQWAKVNRRPVSDRSIKVTGLIEGAEYEFRVAAENVAGIGEFSLPSQPATADDPKYPPAPPAFPKVLDTTRSTVEITWGKPAYDGDSPITGYFVEMANPESPDNFERVATTHITKYTMTGLSDGREYRFRIKAVNAIGESEPSEVPGSVAPKDILEPPGDLDVSMMKALVIRAGNTIRLYCGLKGRPAPKASWTKLDGELSINRVDIKTSDWDTTLLIPNCNRDDSGKYILNVENTSGVKSTTVIVRVQDTPGPPGPIIIKEVTLETVSIAWESPINDGGSTITSYVIEKRESTRKAWATVTAQCSRTSWTINKLETGKSYYFRVMAENEYGIGIPFETPEPVKITQEPGPVQKLEIVETTKSSAVLNWLKPNHDGGSRLIGYIVELAPKDSDDWEVVSEDVKVLSYKITGLSDGKEYSIRVSAKNQAGTGQPRERNLVAKDETTLPTFDLTELSNMTFSAREGTPAKLKIPVQGAPKPEIKWTKDDENLKEDTRVSVEVTAISTVVVFKEVRKEDAGKYIVAATNVVGKKTALIKFVVVGKPGVPYGPCQISDLTAEHATLTWKSPKDNGGSEITNYIVEKRDISTGTWSLVTSSIARPTCRASGLIGGNEYTFRVMAENRFGVSSPLLSETVVAKYPFNVPYAPAAPEVTSCKRDSMVVQWKPPRKDGGSPVTGYIVEIKERNSILWKNLCKTHTTDCRALNLNEGLEYQFRVYALNQAGQSDPSETSTSKYALDPVGPPTRPIVYDSTNESISVRWEAPKFDGGHRIAGYDVERLNLPGKNWIRCNVGNISATNFEVTHLTPGSRYDFRIRAKNTAGSVSEPSETTGPIVCKEEYEPASISLDAALLDGLVVRAGEDVQLHAITEGKPVPNVTWSLNDKELRETDDIKAERTIAQATLTIKNIHLVNAGNYTVTASNHYGSKSATCRVQVLDRPGPPENIAVTDVTSSRAKLTWSAPRDDGGAHVTHYVVEKRETSRLAWTLVTNQVEGTSLRVSNLLEQNEYVFRVMGVNKYGQGEAAESQPLKAENPFTLPCKPTQPEVTNVTRDSCVLTWTRPNNDGGSEITNYVLEKRERRGTRWVRATRKNISECRFRITGLPESAEIEFRVAAENAAGTGEPSEPSSYVSIVDPIYPPGPPSNPKTTETTRKSATVSWGKPMYDGGSEIIGYAVQYAEVKGDEVDEDTWVKCPVPVRYMLTEYTVGDLVENREYRLRVAAVNKAGVGEFVMVSGKVVAKDVLLAPDMEIDASLRQALKVKAGNSIRLFSTFRGSPAPMVTWRKDEGKLPDLCHIDTTDSTTLLLIEDSTRNDAGRYVLTVENSSGTKTVSITVKVLDTPGPVKNLKVTEVTREHAVISWEMSEVDGGSVVNNYIIEKRETTRKAYQAVGSTPHRTTFKITGLTEGDSYFFRVLAENEYGVGVPCETLQAVKISEVPSLPDEVEVRDITNTSATIAWTKPHDGGSPITGYVIEHMQKGGFESWTVGGSTKNTYLSVGKLNTGKDYVFRVRAQNDVGISDGRETNTVTIRELLIAPNVDTSKLFNNTVNEKVGTNIHIRVPYTGTPTPIAHFIRNGEPIKQTSRVNSDTSDGIAKLNIGEVTRKDAGEYELVVKNAVGTKTATLRVVVMEKPAPPGPMEIKDVSAESITVAWGQPGEDGGTPVTHYTLEKLDCNIGWTEVSGFVVRTSQKITRLTTGQEYIFRVRAANKFGLSEPLDSAPVMARHPFNKPGTPSAPQVVSVTNDSVVITWQEPTNDGSAILGYHIERKDRNSIMWTKANSYIVRDSTFKCGNLSQGLSYEFRVTAENLAGLGKVSKISEAVITRDPIEPPRDVHVTRVNRTSVTLEWRRPEYDGGSKITGYIIEKADVPSGRWMKCNFNKVIDQTFEADGLIEGKSYEFRVIAQNAAGSVSKPSDSTGSVTARDEVEPASVDVDAQYRDVVCVKAGEAFTLKTYVSGKTSQFHGEKDGNEFESGPRVSILTTETTSNVTVKDAHRADSGTYTIKVHNLAGDRSIGINVRVLDTPGMCELVTVSGITAEKCNLAWQSPTLNGGAKVTGYSIEKRETSRLAWTVVVHGTEFNQHKVTGLINGNEYVFRVRAENKFGLGEPVETNPVVAKNPFVVADAPGVPEVSNIMKNSCTVMWTRPESDGGAEITGYIVERREKNSARWHRVNRRLVSDLRLRVTDLREGSEQEFRIYAENRAGVGQASESSGFVTMTDPLYVPEAPGIPRVTDSTKSSVSLRWSKPMYDGGADIIGYSLEYAEVAEKDEDGEFDEESVVWGTAVDKNNLRNTSYTISGLTHNKNYRFRVCAHNSCGASSPAITATKVMPVERFEPPTFGPDTDLRKTLTVRAGGSVRLAVPISGRPTPSVSWSRTHNGLKERAIIDTTDTMTVLVIENVTRDDTAKYTLTLTNQSGTVAAGVMVKVLDTPGPPEELAITGMSKSAISVSWKAPEIDGGSNITNYILERREATKKSWSTVETACTRTSYKFSKLNEGFRYYFRVMAENEYGIGSPAETQHPVRASEEPGPPKSIQCTDITNNSVTLQWQKPDYDGGSEILDYTIEQQMKGFDQWTKVKVLKSSTFNYVVPHLNENQQYTFRVSARNDTGPSPSTELSGYVLTRILAVSVKSWWKAKLVQLSKHPFSSRENQHRTTQWKRDGAELKMTSRVNYDTVEGNAILTIKDADLKDAGNYQLVLENSIGSKTVPVSVRVLDKPGPPKGPVEFSGVTADSLVLSWSAPEADGGAAINNYIVDMRETSGDATEWRMISGSTARNSLKVTRLRPGMEYAFRIRAENRFGIGHGLESPSIKAQFPFKTPGSPSAPTVVATTRETMTIKWEVPMNDGGSKILGYHVEKKDRNSILWMKCSKTLVSGTEYKITNLQEGLEYEFRVYAENAAGFGKTSKSSDSAIARDAVDPPRDVEPTGVTRTSVDLIWRKPENDGGAKVSGYVVERRELPNGRWLKCNFSNLIDCKYTVTGLTEDASYEFQVTAKNASGSVSAPSEPSEKVTCKDSFTPPRLDLNGNLKDTVVVKAGETITLSASIFGKPVPTATWTRNNVELDNTPKTEIMDTGSTASLSIKDSTRDDSGDYVLHLKNTAGSRAISITVKVLDRPGQPIGPLTISEVTSERCRLAWRAPENNGGAPVTHYNIEKRETSRLAWTLVESGIEGVTTKVHRLLKGNEYIFRVIAVNKYGLGVPLESVPVIAKDPFSVPAAPGKPQVSTVMRNSAVLTWTRPTSDGGSDISGYHIERKERNSLRWTRAVRRSVPSLHHKVTGLSEGSEYEFRVSAENAAGIGPPSECSTPALCKEPVYVPGPTGIPKVVDTTKHSISLAWAQPSFDGGSPVTGYQVEVCQKDADTEEWAKCTPPSGVKSTDYTVTDLQQNREYKFRISAMNMCGTGEAVQLPISIETTDRLEVPEISGDGDLRKNLTVKSGTPIKIVVPIRGRPVPSVRWSKEGAPSVGERTQIETTETGTTLLIPESSRSDSGKYTLTLDNTSGSTSASCSVKVLDTPGPCQNLSVKDISKDYATATWKPPANDGGSNITNYIVEKKETGRKAWSTITTGCQRTHLKINLSEGLTYLFRVMAENENGIGVPVETSTPVKATEVPGSPDRLEIVDVTKSSVALQWRKPDIDGGSKILGYVIESLEKDQNKWMKRITVKEPQASITNLKEGQEYAFRVIALNEVGASDPREASSLVLIRDTFIAPSLDLSQLPHSVAHVKAGDNLDISIPYVGKPKPSIKWVKDNATVRITKRVDTGTEDDGITRLKIKEITQDDAGVYELHAENQGGKRCAKISVIVLDKPGAVEDLQTSNVTESSVTLSWKAPAFDGGSAISSYVVDFRTSEEPEWRMVSSAIVRTTFKCTKLNLGKEYTFRIRAMNRFGLGPATCTETVTIQLSYKVPGAPASCTVSYACKDSMVVNWQEPVKDGGSQITGYHLEVKDRNSILWKKANRVVIRSTHFRVLGLQEGLEYEYRVSAENAAGIGKPSRPSEAAFARDPVDIPRDVEVVDITRATCLVRWKKPEYDGGQKIVGYNVEKRDLPIGRWTKASFNIIPDNEYLVTGLNGGAEYEFRVIAKNAAGIFSEPSASTGAVRCEDDFRPPRINLDAHLLDEVTVTAGSTLRLHAGISGKPPAITWSNNGKDIREDLRHVVDTTIDHCSILIKDCSKADSGVFTINAKNACGEKSANVKVLVLDKPGPPTGPIKFSRVTDSRVTCSWEPPMQDGSKIIHYIISKRETSRLAWSVVNEKEELCTLTVQRLIKNNEYQFRIQAVNKGVGEPLDSEPVVAKNNFTEPSAPGQPEINNVCSSGCTVMWSRPESDGGADIDGYIVERRERKSARWIKCNKKIVRDLRFKLSNLSENNEYEFRVAAENAAGIGAYSHISLPVVMRDPIDVPGPPSSPRVRDTTRNSVMLSWGHPAYNGGSDVIGYILESKIGEADDLQQQETDETLSSIADNKEWKLVQSNILDTKYTIEKLDHDTLYRFRVSAINKGGVGEPAAIVGAIKPVDRLEPPEYDLDASLRKTVLVRAGNTVNISIAVKGRPTPNVTWTKDNLNVTKNPKVHVDNVDGKTILVIQDCTRDDTGKYALALENASGVASTFVSIRVLDTPGQPGSLKVKQVTQEYAIITWDAPLIDGGSEVFNYHVDKRDTTHRSWSSVTRDCKRLTWKIDGLNKGNSYFFRVLAENHYGLGVAAESEAVTATEIPSIVNDLRIEDITNKTISLTWAKPDSDGGSPISNYVVDFRVKDAEKWTTTKTRHSSAVLEKLKTGEKYEIRVAAENEAGASEWSVVGPVIAKEQQIPPEADLSSIPGRIINMREGGNIRLDIPFFGKPSPLIKWSKDRIPLKQGERLVYERTRDTAILMIKDIKKVDAGQYILHLESAAGRKEAQFTLNVYGNPGKIKGLIEFPDITANSIVLKWTPPENNGGSDITNYIIEKKETSSDTWSSVNANCSRTTVKAIKLNQNSEYVFRIAAENKYGLGEFTESQEVVAKYPFRTPTVPPQPEVVEISADVMTVVWKECHSDGGSQITGYHIEKKERNAILWTKANLATLRSREFKATGLTEGLEYQFRVYAENMAGKSAPSEASKPERAHNVVSPPTCPDWTDITRDSVTLVWKPPKSDGGSKIIGYNIEKRSGADGRWLKCNYTNVQDCEFTATALNSGEKYQFRVTARNASGTVSKPSIPSAEVVCHDDFQPPMIQLDTDILDGVNIRAGVTLRLKANVTGKPAPKIVWTRDGKELVSNAQTEITKNKNVCMVTIKDTTRLNSGCYVISARNPCATKTMEVKVLVLDKPGPPEGPVKFTSLTQDKVTLWWGTPKDTGGSTVESYVVEKRETTRLNWALVTACSESTNQTVNRLIKNHEYQFRISAQNKYGVGTPLLSEPVVAKVSYTVPDAPGQPQIGCKDITSNSITINWDAPLIDGGAMVKNYIIEKREV